MSSDDVTEIIALINLYGLITDTQKWELFDCVFTPDIDANCPPNGHWVDLKSFTEQWATFHEPLTTSTHTFTNHRVHVAGDRANALSYVIVRLVRPMPHGEDYYESAGWYDDALVRTQRGWRINSRLYGGNWWHGNPRVGGDDLDPGVWPLRQAVAEGKVRYLNALCDAMLQR